MEDGVLEQRGKAVPQLHLVLILRPTLGGKHLHIVWFMQAFSVVSCPCNSWHLGGAHANGVAQRVLHAARAPFLPWLRSLNSQPCTAMSQLGTIGMQQLSRNN